MIYPLPTHDAEIECRKLIALFDEKKRIDIDVSNSEKNEKFSTDYVWGKALGQMFGVCVCLDSQGNRVILKAFSCQYAGEWIVSGWVPPLFDVKKYVDVVQKNDTEIHMLTSKIDNLKDERDFSKLTNLKQKRKSLSRKSMQDIFLLYEFNCPKNQLCLNEFNFQDDYLSAFVDKKNSIMRFSDIFSDFCSKKFPPTGTGDCCAPKLLNFANKNNLRPISLAEFYYGETNNSKTRFSGIFYPPCDEKCKPILKYLLGIDIIYRDDFLVVVQKPSGLLSVPGRGDDKQDCVVSRVKRLFPNCINQPAVHRLDMATSGLMVIALTDKVHRDLSKQFEEGRVEKKYIAILENELPFEKGENGKIELPFRLDINNRPYQIYDPIYGKMGVTLWKSFADRKTIVFTPLTGRTHQLRVHAASEKGLGIPIAGDNLYGHKNTAKRLMLHASYLSFTHPVTMQLLTFESEPVW